MENASKALIIAGAILISILIIALGVFIYNNAANTVKSADMTEYEIQAFNSKFERYIGKNQSLANAKSLMDAIKANNQVSTNSKVKVNVFSNVASKQLFDWSDLTSSGSTEDYNTFIANAKKENLYQIGEGNGTTVKPTLTYENGIITQIGIVITKGAI